MFSCNKKRAAEKIADNNDLDIFSNDTFIVFLDAASDGNCKELMKAYERAGNKRQSLLDRG